MIEKLINKKINIYNFEENPKALIDKKPSIIQSENNIKKTPLKEHKIPPIENFVSFRESGQIPSFLIDK